METKANFFLIGAFTLGGLGGILTFFLWFAQVELDRQFDYYDIRFSSVAGLGNASDVRFSGLPIGQVVDVRLSPERDGTILVRVEVDAETPVRTDSIATIEAQGVTGVSFVGIKPGSASSPLLEPTEAQPFPEITAGRSTLQTLSEDAPRLLQLSLETVEDVSELLGAENRQRLENILSNVETASANFAQTLQDFSSVTATVGDFAQQINRFNATLDTLTGDITSVLESADVAIVSIGELSEQGKGVLSISTETLTSAQAAIERTERFVEGELSLTAEELRQTAAELRLQASSLGEDVSALMATLGTTGETATARLSEAESTLQAADALIARLNETTAVVGSTVTNIDKLLQDEAAPLLSDVRAMVADAERAIASVASVATEDLPIIIADMKSAATTFRKVTAEVGEDLTTHGKSAGQLIETARGTLEEASLAFSNANDTLSAINAALETGDRALTAAESAFSGAGRVLNEDLAGIITKLESTLDNLNAAVGQVSGDLPGISQNLRAASQSASDTFAELRRVTGAAAPAVQEFTKTALPLYTRLAQESRTLIANLDRLTTQIQRDPTRFFLDRERPEFRR
ncbi:MCE family protein [Marinovum sp.]|uniref:MCE family protein n=1 Tax=Marinovum sp. TaxID=2024839 RepID=UPI002B26E74B|nr:MlaD family protein [Marinovum sp.]